MLNTRGRQKVKEILVSHGIRFINLTNQDILIFQLPSEANKPTAFFNTLNKIGVQYKTVEKVDGKWTIKLWPKGERPSSEKMKKDKKTKNNSSKPDRSNYIKRIAEKLRIISEKMRPPSETSVNIFEALTKEEGQREAFSIIKRSLEKHKGDSISIEPFLKWVNEEIDRRDKLINALNQSFKKVTQTFEDPKK